MTKVNVPDVPAVLVESDDDMAQAMGALFGSLVSKARGYYDVIEAYATQDERILSTIETSTDDACVAFRQAQLEKTNVISELEQQRQELDKKLAATKAEAEKELAPLESAARAAAMGPDDVTPEKLAKASEGVRNVASTAAKNVSLLKAMTNIDLGDWAIPVTTTRGTRALGSGETTFTPAFSKIVVNDEVKGYNKMFELARDIKISRPTLGKLLEDTLGAGGQPGRQVWEAMNVGDSAPFTAVKKGNDGKDTVYKIVVTKTVKGAQDAPEPEDTDDDNVDGVDETVTAEA